MFVVKRPFRNLGKVLTAGTIISDPAVIKHFKGRFAEGKIIKVDEHNFDSYYSFFKQKYGVDLAKPNSVKVSKENASEPAEAVKAAKGTDANKSKATATVKATATK